MTVLTEQLATLRVIEMNSAQLTVGEFRQLDIVAIEELHGLGRVNIQDGPSRAPSDRWPSPWVIGRHMPDADDSGRAPLARCLLQPDGWAGTPVIDRSDLSGPISACRALGLEEWSLDGRSFDLSQNVDVQWCTEDNRHDYLATIEGAAVCEPLWTAVARVIEEIRSVDRKAHV